MSGARIEARVSRVLLREGRSYECKKLGTHGVICDYVDAGDLLEALDDHAQGRTAEVLGSPAGEELLQRRATVTKVRFRRDCLANAVVRLLHACVCVGLPV